MLVQISVDLFCINRQYSDITSISAITRHSSGCLQYYGKFQAPLDDGQALDGEEQLDFDRFSRDFRRYLTRKIGFEAVMRTRFTKGLDLTVRSFDWSPLLGTVLVLSVWIWDRLWNCALAGIPWQPVHALDQCDRAAGREPRQQLSHPVQDQQQPFRVELCHYPGETLLLG